MKKILALVVTLLLGVALCACGTAQPAKPSVETTTGPSASDGPQGWGLSSTWERPFESGVQPSMFVEGVSNPYWPLAPGTTWSYEASTDDGTETIDVEVLSETKAVMGITCTVVRDTVKLDGELVEDTIDWYAQDTDGNVWYMGEDTKEYEDGKIESTAGSWEAGIDGAQPGIKIWGTPHVGGVAYYQEFYQGEAEDLAKDLATDGAAETPAGVFDGLLVVEEWTPLDPGFVERKYYQAGVGTVKEEMVKGGSEVVLLTKFERL